MKSGSETNNWGLSFPFSVDVETMRLKVAKELHLHYFTANGNGMKMFTPQKIHSALYNHFRYIYFGSVHCLLGSTRSLSLILRKKKLEDLTNFDTYTGVLQ